MPLVISDIKSQVEGDEGLLINFEGVNGNPIVCGISVKKDSNVGELEIFSIVPHLLRSVYISSKELVFSCPHECVLWLVLGSIETDLPGLMGASQLTQCKSIEVYILAEANLIFYLDQFRDS